MRSAPLGMRVMRRRASFISAPVVFTHSSRMSSARGSLRPEHQARSIGPILPGGPLASREEFRGPGGTEENYQVSEARAWRQSTFAKCHTSLFKFANDFKLLAGGTVCIPNGGGETFRFNGCPLASNRRLKCDRGEPLSTRLWASGSAP